MPTTKLRSMLRRATRRLSPDFGAAGFDAQTLHPSETAPVRPALRPPGHVERIIQVQSQTSMQAELDRIDRTEVTHMPTLAYELGPAVLDDGFVYAGRHAVQVLTKADPDGARGVRMNRACIGSTALGCRFFGHWFKDELPKITLARQFGEAVTLFDPFKKHTHADYTRLYDAAGTPVARGRFDNLIVIDDRAQNAHKFARYERFRARIRETVPAPDSVNQIAMLVRGDTGVQRRLTNEQALADRLAKRGAAILNPESLTAEQIQRELRDCRLIVAVEGSAIAHSFFTAHPRAALIALQPPRRFNNFQKVYCDCLGWAYGFYVCQPDPNDEHAFTLDDMDAFDRLCDQLLESQA